MVVRIVLLTFDVGDMNPVIMRAGLRMRILECHDLIILRFGRVKQFSIELLGIPPELNGDLFPRQPTGLNSRGNPNRIILINPVRSLHRFHRRINRDLTGTDAKRIDMNALSNKLPCDGGRITLHILPPIRQNQHAALLTRCGLLRHQPQCRRKIRRLTTGGHRTLNRFGQTRRVLDRRRLHLIREAGDLDVIRGKHFFKACGHARGFLGQIKPGQLRSRQLLDGCHRRLDRSVIRMQLQKFGIGTIRDGREDLDRQIEVRFKLIPGDGFDRIRK